MKKSLFILAIVVAFISASCQQGGAGKKVKMESEIDSTSYALGVLIGQQNKQGLATFPGGSELNLDIMAEAFRLYLKGDSTVIGPEQANEIVGNFFDKKQNETSQKNLEEGNAFLEKNKAREGVITTASGLQYEVVTEGTGAKPAATDVVKVHYHGTTIDGKVFDSSVDRGEPVEFPVGQVIQGWVEALQLMPVGSKWKLYIPSELGYGVNGAGSDIAPNSVLIFDVELLEIVTPKQ